MGTVIMFYILTCLFFLATSKGENCTQYVGDMVQQMRNEMKNELKNELRAEMKAEMWAEMIAELKAEMRAEMKADIPITVSRAVKEMPYVLVCAYRESWPHAGATITYGYLIADFNNKDKPGGGNGHMNIQSGVFTAVTHGYYTVTISAQ